MQKKKKKKSGTMVFVCAKKNILDMIYKCLSSLCMNAADMLHFSVWVFFVWLNSSVLFTWEINLRPYDGHYPPTDTWANTPILYEHEPAGAHARRQTQEHMFASMQYKHTQGACARSTYLHTLIENRQTYSPTCHLNTVHAYFSGMNCAVRCTRVICALSNFASHN